MIIHTHFGTTIETLKYLANAWDETYENILELYNVFPHPMLVRNMLNVKKEYDTSWEAFWDCLKNADLLNRRYGTGGEA